MDPHWLYCSLCGAADGTRTRDSELGEASKALAERDQIISDQKQRMEEMALEFGDMLRVRTAGQPELAYIWTEAAV